MKDEDKDLAQVLADTPWGAIIIPMAAALVVIALTLISVLIG